MSYDTLHSINNRALPNQMLLYKLALTLFKLYNFRLPQFEWLNLNFDQILTSRQVFFEVINAPHFRVGNNVLVNRLSALNRKIPLVWLTLELSGYKLKCKEKFLK